MSEANWVEFPTTAKGFTTAVITGYDVDGNPVYRSESGNGSTQVGNVPHETVGRVSFSPITEAAKLVHGSRQDAYGHPGPLYSKVGRAWAAILDVPEIDAETVLIMMAVMKAVRYSHRPSDDSLTDLAGYAEAVALARDR